MSKSSDVGHPPCPVYEQCGGCRTLHLDDDRRRERFTSRLRGALGSRRSTAEPAPEVAMPPEGTALRHRIALHLRGDGRAAEGGLPGRTHGFVKLDACPVTQPRAMAVAQAALAAIQSVECGGISALLVHLASDGERALLTLVSESSRVYRAQDIAREAIAAGATSVATNQRDADRRLLGRRSVPVAGAFPFVDHVDGMQVRVLATTPFEPNHWSAARVIADLCELVGPVMGRTAVLRAGNGLSAMALCRAGAEVAAVDDRPEIAHEAAGSYLDGGFAVRVTEGRNREAVSSLSGGRQELVVVEAGRGGTEPEQLAAIARLVAPPTIALVERSFEGLARDLAALTDLGYTLTRVRAHAADPYAGEVTSVLRLDRPRG